MLLSQHSAQAITDADIYDLALNLEYLEVSWSVINIAHIACVPVRLLIAPASALIA